MICKMYILIMHFIVRLTKRLEGQRFGSTRINRRDATKVKQPSLMRIPMLRMQPLIGSTVRTHVFTC